LGKVENFKPDMFISDVQIPGMDGYETCKKTQENEITASISVVFLTANSSKEA
jgi:CheY-like chemotaxis protein|tara:strand:+ start:215 stop:373 length:159 start_codon:yes stop_codon:yes gene_type:complete